MMTRSGRQSTKARTGFEFRTVLIFSKVEIRWDDAGEVIQDTFIDLTNDWGEAVSVNMYFVNGDAPLEATDDEIVAVSSGGVTIRLDVREISSQGRDATGVRIMNLDDGQTVASVAPIIAEGDEE